MIVINQSTNEKAESKSLVRAIVGYVEGILELGWCSPDDSRLINCQVVFEDIRYNYVLKTTGIMNYLIYSNRKGRYIFSNGLSEENILLETLTYGKGGFPYSFEKEYEAVNCFNFFENKQFILNNAEYPISKLLKYSFGLEFETAAGYIPQELCFRDGLIPLRDGSLEGGIEYSTVVLQGNSGINLLKQQIDTLKSYTCFNKECSLHFHFGGYPVTAKHIWALYVIWKIIENEISEYIPKYSFRTAEYKNSGKDYCKPLPIYNSFGQLYSYLAGQKFFGSLTQVHPADPDKRSKWNIHSRYHNVNLVNMVCYKGPKTVEFRFLRPTFNFHKILFWLYIFNALLSYSESIADSVNDIANVVKKVQQRRVNLERILLTTYSADVCESLMKDLTLLKIIVINQSSVNDFIGGFTNIEDQIFNPDIII